MTLKITCIGIEKPFFMKIEGSLFEMENKVTAISGQWLTNGTVYVNTQNIIKIEVIENE